MVEYSERTTYLSKELISFITCGCEYSAPFFVIFKAEREILLKVVLKHQKSIQTITKHFCLIIKSLNTDGEQFQQYQQSNHPSLITYH